MKWNWNMTSIKLIPFSCCAFTFYFCFCASPDILCSIYNYIAIIIKKIDVKIKWNSKISIIYFYRNWGRNISNDIRLKLKYVCMFSEKTTLIDWLKIHLNLLRYIRKFIWTFECNELLKWWYDKFVSLHLLKVFS